MVNGISVVVEQLLVLAVVLLLQVNLFLGLRPFVAHNEEVLLLSMLALDFVDDVSGKFLVGGQFLSRDRRVNVLKILIGQPFGDFVVDSLLMVSQKG